MCGSENDVWLMVRGWWLCVCDAACQGVKTLMKGGVCADALCDVKSPPWCG